MKKKPAYIQMDKIEKNSYIWNTVAGMLNAFQSVIILIVLTRVLGLYDAGVFTIAYATAILMLTVGKFGMRNFQVTDIREQYSFGEYKTSRVITVLTMIVASILYIVYALVFWEYTIGKATVVIVMCLLKCIDAIEDIYHGLYQQKGRLDIAAKLLAYRMMITIGVLCTLLVITHDQLISLSITTLISFLFFLLSIQKTKKQFEISKSKIDRTKVFSLLVTNFSLFISSFLMLYIGNAPKYAIDSILNSEMQACYGFISMPIFVIGLLNQFIYQPILTRMASQWNNCQLKLLVREIIRQCVYIACLTIAVIVIGYLMGIPILSIMYGTDLSAYKKEFIILLFGGGLLALAGFLTTTLTIMRRQNKLIIGYVLVSLFALMLSPVLVRSLGMMGASILYLGLMMLLSGIFVFILINELRKKGSIIS